MSHRAGAPPVGIGILGSEDRWAWPCAGSGECGCSRVGWGSQETPASYQVILGVRSMTISYSSHPNLPQPTSTGYRSFLFLQEIQLKTRGCSNQVAHPELLPLLCVLAAVIFAQGCPNLCSVEALILCYQGLKGFWHLPMPCLS